MAGLAPFGRDDQPLLEVKIIGGKRVEIAVDKYGKPLNDQSKSINLQGARFQGQQVHRSSSGKISAQVPTSLCIHSFVSRKQ